MKKRTHLKTYMLPVPLLCGAVLSILASLFTPTLPSTIQGKIPAQPHANSPTITVAAIDPTVISIGDTQAGDNWPSTWADDGNIYTYLGDGTGFGLPSGMSMYPAKISGSPATGDISGENIVTNAVGKGTGGGASGKKVSGLLSLMDPTSPTGHVLYAWVRNITGHGGASLMYSYDHASTWNWAWGNPDTTPSAIISALGYPTWMQAGKNNEAAQDGYLYFYSQDAPTAYQVADTVLLGRVSTAQVRVQSAYQ